MLVEDYNKESMTATEKAGESVLKYFSEHKKLVFRDERRAFLLPFIAFFNALDTSPRNTPPRIIAQLAMQTADFAYANTNNRYLAEDELSRYIQKLQRELKNKD